MAKNRKYKLRCGTIGKNAIEAEVTKEVEELDMNSATYGRADKWASHGDVTTSLTHYQAHLGVQPQLRILTLNDARIESFLNCVPYHNRIFDLTTFNIILVQLPRCRYINKKNS